MRGKPRIDLVRSAQETFQWALIYSRLNHLRSCLREFGVAGEYGGTDDLPVNFQDDQEWRNLTEERKDQQRAVSNGQVRNRRARKKVLLWWDALGCPPEHGAPVPQHARASMIRPFSLCLCACIFAPKKTPLGIGMTSEVHRASPSPALVYFESIPEDSSRRHFHVMVLEDTRESRRPASQSSFAKSLFVPLSPRDCARQHDCQLADEEPESSAARSPSQSPDSSQKPVP